MSDKKIESLDAYVVRQPIYDSNLNVFAYELLYRSGSGGNFAGDIDGNLATSQVIINSLINIGLENIVGNRLAFFNMTRDFIVGKNPIPFNSDKIILEILEDVEADDEVVNSVKDLVDQGYVFALDDFVFHEGVEPLIPFASIIKVEFPALKQHEVIDHVNKLRRFNVKLLAEKVETQEEFDFCKKLGFDYYQGYFFCKPKIIKGRRIPSNRISTMRVLAELQNPDVSVNDLEKIISQDVTLSFKILRCVNSAAFSISRKVESIKKAVVYLGLTNIKRWATLIVLSGMDDKPQELIVTSLIRSKMCELLGEKLKYQEIDSCSTVGLFSILDALMDAPMDELLSKLPLSVDVNDALMSNKGTLGKIIKCVIAYEQGIWDETNDLNLDVSVLSQCYVESLQWADELTNDLF